VPCVEEREQRNNAAFAAIVRAQDQNGVFEPNDEEKRPEDQRDNAHDRLRCGPPAGVDRLLQPIERAGANIAVDDAESREHHDGGQLSDVLRRHPIASVKGLGHPKVPSPGNAALEGL